MYYAIMWNVKNDVSVRKEVAGWTIHETIENALDIKEIHIENTSKSGRIYLVEITLPDFDKNLFKAILTQGYFFTEETDPDWMFGSNATHSKLA